ncbi:hypothetical protein J437_LFUL008013 [Ladona fulva]|uniref:Uncharacterized protein n=1 Tax=Ladona fulva TaxID=123851 RepID=A0A8K0P6A7_LADFU|nr:hypothetical protein J437_LFUL008013 [Ladona fulva]
MPGSSSMSPLLQPPPPPSTSAPSPTLASSAGGTFSSYTPSKIQIGEDFQLGITRTVPQPSTSHAFNQTDASKEDNTEEKEEYLKPAEEGVTWSAETAADLLF